MKILKANIFVLLTFILSLIVLIITFAERGMYPFGNEQIMIIDSWHQYYPLFQELHTKLTSGESLFYSWNTGMGANFLVLISYYAMSPLNLLSVVVPHEYIREFFWLITVVKIGLGGMFFSIYVRGLSKRNDLSITIFGLLYAFSGFMMGYYWNLMWLDAVALLPLVILGLHQLLDKDKYLLYVITLTIIVMSNFYIAYFICEFIVLYFFVLYFSKFRFRFKHFAQKLIQIISFSFLGLGLSAVLLIPIVNGMRNAYGLSSGNPKEFDTYYSLLEILNNLLIGVKPTIVDGLPNIASGMVSLILLILYFTFSKISQKSKWLHGGLLGFLIISLNINFLNFAWHGFHFPNQVPYRFSFLVSFMILTMAAEAYTHLEELKHKQLMMVLGGFFAYLIINEALPTEVFDIKVFYIAMGVVVIYGIIFALLEQKKIAMDTFRYILIVTVILESFFAIEMASVEAGNSGRGDYITLNDQVQRAFETIEREDTSLYRLEIDPKYSANDPLMYRYKGISQFSSTANAKISTFTRKIGLPSDAGSNTIAFNASTPALNGMIGIKYMISKNDTLRMPNIAYDLVHEESKVKAYLNRYWLPMGFMVNEEVFKLNLNEKSPFVKQQSFYDLATGNTIPFFTNIPVDSQEYTNMEVTRNEESRFHYKNLDSNQIGKAKVVFKALNTEQLYLNMLNQTKTMDLIINGVSKSYQTPRSVTVDLGIVEKDTLMEVSFEVPAATTGFFDLEVVSFDGDAFEEAIVPLRAEAFQIQEYSDTKIKGIVEAYSDGMMYTSIPYDKGWSLMIDGVEEKAIAYKDAMLMFPIKEGTHSIVLTYRTDGLFIGLIVSLLSLLGLSLNILLDKKMKKREKSKTNNINVTEVDSDIDLYLEESNTEKESD